MRTSLFAQFVFWGTVIVGSCGASVYYIHTAFFSRHNRGYTQQVFWNRAPLYVGELAPALGSVNFDETKLKESLLQLQMKHPLEDFYILDEQGFIKAHFPDPLAPAAPVPLQTNIVDVRPVQSFLQQKNFPKGGVWGTDPYDLRRPKLFVAAEVLLGSRPGYLYVLLKKDSRRIGIPLMQRRWYYPWIEVFACLLISMWLLYALLFLKPVRRIVSALEQLTAGSLEHRVIIDGHNELALIGCKINDMAGRIQSTVGELNRSDRLQREMLAALTHDFGSPLFSAQAYLDKMRNGRQMTAEEKEVCLDVAAKNIDRLRELVSSFFELSKLDSRDLKPSLKPFSLLDLVTEEIIPKLMPLADSKRVRLKAEFENKLPRVVGDMPLIDRVITNLAANGINFNRPGGEVIIRLSRDNGKIRIEVIDDGMGINEKDLPFIFDRFFRSDESRSGATGGTGLGLAIVKKILEAHNEGIEVESIVNKGSRFTFVLKTFCARGSEMTK